MVELNIKVGDKIFYKNKYGNQITTVTDITPTGRIRVECSPNIQFDKYGNIIGKHDIWSSGKLEIYNEQKAQKIVDDMLVEQVLNIIHNIKTLTPKQARKIFEILKENDDE